MAVGQLQQVKQLTRASRQTTNRKCRTCRHHDRHGLSSYVLTKAFTDFASLMQLETRAAVKYLEAGYDYTQWEVTSLATFKSFAEQGQLWVAVTAKGEAAGFALIAPVWTNLHLHEIDTDPVHMGRGVGSLLLGALITWAKAGDYDAMTLRTFRTTPWSVGLYKKFGFQMTEDPQVQGTLSRYLQSERGLGVPAGDRCTMILKLK